MDQLEKDVRDTLRDPRRALPGDLVTVARVHAGASVRRRRRAAAVPVAAALAALVVAVPVAFRAGGPAEDPGPASTRSAVDVPTPSASQRATTAPTAATTPTTSPSAAPALPWDGAAPIAVTAIGLADYYVLGEVGPCSTNRCLRLARTRDGGATFEALVPPPAFRVDSPGPQSGSAGAVRFGSANDGWAFGGGLWATHDGARSWTHVPLPGPAGQVEAAAGRAYALVLDDGADRATLWTSATTDDRWTRLPGPGGLSRAARLALQGRHVIVLDGDTVWTGDPGSAFTRHAGPCQRGLATQLSATVDAAWAVCGNGTSASVFRSVDGGASFTDVPVRLGGNALSNQTLVGSRDSQAAVLAVPGDTGLVVVDQRGRPLFTLSVGTGWAYVGFTSPRIGYALTCCSVRELLRTTDSGAHWTPVRVSTA